MERRSKTDPLSSPTLLVATISASDIAASGNVAVTVFNYSSDNVTVSNGLSFLVSASNVVPTLVLSTQSIKVSASTTDGGGPLIYNPVAIAVNGPSSATYYYSISFTGSAVARLAVNGTTAISTGTTIPSGPTAGRITGEPDGGLGATIKGTFNTPVNFVGQVSMVGAATLGAGTYTDTISVNVCSDAQCTKPIAVANATVQSNLDGSATVSLTTKPPASLGSGIYTDSVQLEVCHDSTCTRLYAGPPLVIQVTYIVDASPGIDFTQASITTNQISDMAWNATTQRIYATANSETGGITHSLLVINPVTASIEHVVALGDEIDPTGIAITDDGQYAYVNSQLGQVVRVDLTSLTVDETVNIYANAIGAVPGEPFVVATSDPKLIIYDGSTPRPNTSLTGGLESNLLFTFGADAGTLYAYDDTVTSPTLYQLPVSSSGFSAPTQTSSVDFSPFGSLYDLEYAGGLLYANTGVVYNPTTQSLAPSFSFLTSTIGGSAALPLGFAIDTSLNRAYFTTTDGPSGTTGDMTLQGFNLTTRAPTWIARFPAGGGLILRWGTNGIAFIGHTAPASQNITFISGSVISR